MLDNEDAEGGFRHHLFCPVVNSKGERYWYSPILGRICQDVAPMPKGGILGMCLTLNPGVECSFLVTLDHHQTAACDADVRLNTGRSLPHDMHDHSMVDQQPHTCQSKARLCCLGCTCDLKGVKLAEISTDTPCACSLNLATARQASGSGA